MNETFVTLQGWVGSDVTLREAGGAPVRHLPGGRTPAALPARRRAGSTATRRGSPSTPGARLADNVRRLAAHGRPGRGARPADAPTSGTARTASR